VVPSILEPDPAAAAAALDRLPPECELAELRADRLTPEDVAGLVGRAPLPLIVTVRREADGGTFAGEEPARRRRLCAALAAGAAFVDVELGSPAAELAEGPDRSRVVLSHHGAECKPERLAGLRREMCRSGAARHKLVPRPASAAEQLALRDLLAAQRTADPPLAAFGLGRAGTWSRVMAPAWGSWATYAAPRRGSETAEGQLSVHELLDVHDVLAIAPKTRLFALVGSSVGNSPSPAMHAAARRAGGLDARYVALELDALEDVLPLLSTTEARGLDALAVTMPFKAAAARAFRPADAIVTRATSANTVVRVDGSWQAHNTDAPAALALLEAQVEIGGSRVAVAGTGGTGRAVAAVLASAGASVTLFNRDPERGSRAASELGLEVRSWEALADEPWDVLVQATPLGARGETLPVRRWGRAVLDAVYAAHETPLAREARARGLYAVDGRDLLVAQAVLQYRLMNGRVADAGVMRAACDAWLARNPGRP
jgi:shikimate dehydrogenase/3-dehydroquinate dehydratase type I